MPGVGIEPTLELPPTTEPLTKFYADTLLGLLEQLEEEGWDLPAPRRISDYSGRTNLRMGQELHYQLAQEAEKSNRSLNSIILELIAKGLGMARA